MAKKKKRKRRSRRKKKNNNGLKQETLHGILAIIFVALGIFFILAGFSQAGVVGEKVFEWLTTLLGIGYGMLPLLSFILATAFFKTLTDTPFNVIKGVGAFIFFLSGLGLVEVFFPDRGGLVGSLIASPIISLFDTIAGSIILLTLFVISVLVVLDIHIKPELLVFWKKDRDTDEEESIPDVATYEDEQGQEDGGSDEDEEGPEDEEESEDEQEQDTKGFASLFGLSKSDGRAPALASPYSPPPLKLLERDRGKPGAGDVKANANIIKRTLANFGINVEIEEVTVGPSITRYAVKPAEGVRLSKIVSLQNNLELALAAHPVRIEAPIPGKSLVGIEIPNDAKTTVGLATLLGQKEFKDAGAPLTIALGREVTGSSAYANIGKMPHLLIAGATGAGKSVTIHTIITSLLYRNGPEQLRFIMIDPKRVELTLYNGIPHLLTPVITDAKKAILALKWLIKEMERRYDLLEEESVRDIGSYHKNIVQPAYDKARNKGDEEEDGLPEAMPYIVVVIDELADIMSAYPRELEAAIVRLAQMSRAVGIHLILSTQRPSVNVITGLIKANIPARVALQVASQVDSRTILDMRGAEKLLGAGDMLYLSADMSKPVRLQSGFVSEKEVKKVVKYLKKHYDDEEMEELELSAGNNLEESDFDQLDTEEEDELYEDARQTVLEAGKGSTSYLQRKLRVGYARAARLMDMLEERGVVGPQEGSKAREVLEEPLNTPEEENHD